MPIATAEQYAAMLDGAASGGYAFTRVVAGHMFANYDGVLKIEGGRKKPYDPRTWGREAGARMAARVAEACEQLASAGRSLLR